MPYNETGLTAGKRDIDYQGQSRVVFTEITVTDYEAGGVPLEPEQTFGIQRLNFVDVGVADGSGYVAQYDYENDAVVLFQQANDGSGSTDDPLAEVPDEETVDVPVRVKAEGRGS